MSSRVHHQSTVKGGLLFLGDGHTVAYGAAVHRDQALQAIAAVGGGGEPQPVRDGDLAHAPFESDCGDVVALVDDDEPVTFGHLPQDRRVSQALSHGDVDEAFGACGLPQLADPLGVDAEVLHQAFAPLFDEGLAVDDDERGYVALGDEGASHDGLSRSGRRHENPEVVGSEGLKRFALAVRQLRSKM